MSSILEQSAAIVGLVIALHASPIHLPKEQPFSCGFCTSVWLAVLYGIFGVIWREPLLDALVRVGMTALIAGLVVRNAGELFRESNA